jgi:hypothetical protein
MARYLTLQNLADTSIVNGDLIGQIGFAASNDSDGGDAIAICSSISVKAEGTFDASNNPGAIVFATAPNNGPTDRLKVTNEGHFVPIADTSYDLGVSGSLHFRDVCLSGIVFDDGTYQTTAATAGGGGTPGGSVNQIQINDGAGGFTTATDSDRLAYIPSTNTLNLGRAIATDLYSGTQVTNFWYGDNFAIGGNNFLSLGATSDRNTAIGYGAAQSLTNGNDDNVIIGYDALNSTTTNCDLSVFVGSQIASNGGSYIGCIGIGGNILSTNSAGSLVGTIGIGYNVFNALTNGPDYDIGIGYNALNIYNESASVGGNIAIGYQAMYNISNGQYNVAIGFNALTNAGTRGGIDDNVIIGRGAAQGATTNFANNVAIGSEALGSTTNNLSTENVIIGRLAAQSCTNIDDSIVIGNNALSTLNLATAGNIILNNRDIYGAGGLVASDANRLLIGDTLGGNLLTKRIKIGGSNVVDVDTAVLEVECNSSTDVGLLVQGAASQSENLTNWENSSNVIQAYIDATGGFSGTCITFGDGTTQCTAAAGGGTPGGNSTEFQYNNGGSFDGTTGVVYEATNGTGILLKVHGTGSPKDNLFSVEYTGVNAETTVSIYRNNASDTSNLFQVRTEASGDLFTVSPTGKVYERSSHGNVEHSGSASSFTFDLDESNIFTATLSSTSSTVSIANGDVGQRFILRLTNGVANAKVGTWFSNINWPGGSPASGSLVNGETNLFGFLTYSGNGGTLYHDGFAIATGVT